jgi:hypothetical protein
MMDKCIYVRLVPGKEPVVEIGDPSFSTVQRLLDMSAWGKLLVISHPATPYISNVYTINPGQNDDIAVMTQHMDGFKP